MERNTRERQPALEAAVEATCWTCGRITPESELAALRGQCGSCFTRHDSLREDAVRIGGGR